MYPEKLTYMAEDISNQEMTRQLRLRNRNYNRPSEDSEVRSSRQSNQKGRYNSMFKSRYS